MKHPALLASTRLIVKALSIAEKIRDISPMDRFKSFPLSVRLLLISIAAILLQLPSFPGIILLMFGGPFWSVILLNGSAMAAGYEAITGRIPRWFLIVPVLWFGGYAVFAVQDWKTYDDLRKDIAASNAHVKIPFHPQTEVLAAKDFSHQLIKSYPLPVVFDFYPDNFGDAQWRSHRTLDGATCLEVAKDMKDLITFDQRTSYENRFDKKTPLCTLLAPEGPRLPVVKVTRTTEERHERKLPVRLTLLTVTTPRQTSYVLTSGTAAPLLPFPAPIIGCALNSGAASWDCDARFGRIRGRPLTAGGGRESSEVEMLAAALGLQPVPQQGRIITDKAFAQSLVAPARQNAAEAAVAILEDLVDGGPVGWPDLSVLRNNRELLVPYADRLMDALEIVVGRSARGTSSGIQLADTLALMPNQQIRDLGPRILALYSLADRVSRAQADSRGDARHWFYETGLYGRLGVIGPQALPVLVEAVNRRRNLENVIRSLCVMGKPAAPAGPTLLALDRDPDFDGAMRDLLYVTLLRAGLGDAIEPRFVRAGWFRNARAVVNPSTPETICSNYRRMISDP